MDVIPFHNGKRCGRALKYCQYGCGSTDENTDRSKSFPKIEMIRIHAHSSRQPLVKGERLVRYEVSAAMIVCPGDRFRLHPSLYG